MGYVRFRRSVKLAPGVRLNVSKSGLGMSFGGPGLRYTIGPNGRRTRTIGIPGTGVSYVETEGGGRSGSRRAEDVVLDSGPALDLGAAPDAPAAPHEPFGGRSAGGGTATDSEVDPAAVLPRASFFASKAERAYRQGLLAHLAGDPKGTIAAFEAALAEEPDLGGAHLFAGVAYNALGRASDGILHLEAIVAGGAPLPDRYLEKFMPPGRIDATLTVGITDEVDVHPPIGEAAAVLILAELLQTAGKLDEAIGLIQQVHAEKLDDPVALLSLADLLHADGDLEAVVMLTDGLEDRDDLSLAALDIRAKALVATGLPDAGLEILGAALAAPDHRDPELLRLVRYDRALAYEAAGRRAEARADLAALYARDSSYRDVKARIASLAGPTPPGGSAQPAP